MLALALVLVLFYKAITESIARLRGQITTSSPEFKEEKAAYCREKLESVFDGTIAALSLFFSLDEEEEEFVPQIQGEALRTLTRWAKFMDS